jgi:toxin ParE1/3/4
MSRVIRRPRARADIQEQAFRIADDNPDAARRFLGEVERSLELLAGMPGMGAARPRLSPALRGLRMFPVSSVFDNHLLFYRPIRDGIELVRVLHGARDIEAIMRAEPDPGGEEE